jgi:hypothetical protein
MQLKVLGYTFPGEFAPQVWVDPRYSIGWPQPVRWFLSAIEYRALDGRTPVYTMGMGDVPIHSFSKNVGGSLGFYVVFLAIFLAVHIRHEKSRFQRTLAIVLVVITAAVAFLPGSQELRYYIAWEILLVIACLLLIYRSDTLSGDRDDDDDGRTKSRLIFSAVVLSSFVFVNSVTGLVFLMPRHSDTLRQAMAGTGVTKARASLTPEQKDICLLDWGPLPFLFDNFFHGDNFNPPGRIYRMPIDERGCGDAVRLKGPY